MSKRKKDTFLRLCFAIVVLVGSTFVADEAGAQQQDEEEQPVLPDLAPREVEIRGELQISFPSLRRQPLVGFNPPPRVPDIPLDRRPLVESYSEAGASIARTQLQKPEPPGVAALSGDALFWAEAEIGTGRYFSRLIRGVASKKIGTDRRLDVRLHYEGSDGHVVSGPEEEIKNASNDFTGSISYGILSDRLSATAEVSGFVSGYSLFGIDNSGGGSVVTNPDRDGAHGSVTISIGSGFRSAVEYEFAASLQRSEFSTGLFPSGSITDPSTERVEGRGSVAARLEFPVSGSSAYVSGNFSSAGLDLDGLVGSDLKQGEIGVGFSRTSDVLVLTAGPRLLAIGYDADTGGATGDDRQATYLSVDVNLSYRSGGILTLLGTNRPLVRTNSLSDLFSANPFLVNEPVMQPSVLPINAEAGVMFSSGAFQFKASVRMRQSPNWQYFVGSTGSGTATVVSGFFDTGYAEGRVTSVGGELALSLPAKLQLSSEVYVHDTELTDLNVQIPNHARLTAQMGLSFPFAARRGIFQVTGRYLGERYGDVGQNVTLDPYLDLDFYTRYDVTPKIGLVLRVRNLGINDHEVWNGYPQCPAVVTGGVRILW